MQLTIEKKTKIEKKTVEFGLGPFPISVKFGQCPFPIRVKFGEAPYMSEI